MLKFNRSSSVLVAVVWVFAAFLLASTTFAATRYVSIKGNNGTAGAWNSCSDPKKP
jgi:hypothetical protein